MQHLRRLRHYGPLTYAIWIGIFIVIAFLGGFSVWSR